MIETLFRRRTVFALVGLVALALALGLAGVYGTPWGAGNGAEGPCAAARDTAGRLKPLAKGEVAALLAADEPQDIRDLGFIGTNGQPTTIASYAGKPILLNLWATWCLPCRAEMPALDRLQAEKGGDRFQVVTVNIDVGDPRKPADFLAETGITHLPDNRDPRMKLFSDLKSRTLAFGMPTTLLVDGKGCQVAAMHGPAEWDSPEALALVDALIATP